MSANAAIQISRGALLAVTTGASSLYLYVNGLVPPGLLPPELAGSAMRLSGSATQVGGELGPLAEQLSALSGEVARLRMQTQYGGVGSNGYYYSGQGWGVSWSTVATAGGVAVLFMYVRGYSFADFMYVTKKTLEIAMDALEQSIETVGLALETAKRELTYKLGLIEDKLDNTRTSLEDKITDEVRNVRSDLENVGNDVRAVARNQDQVHGMVTNIETQIDSIEAKMENANSALTTANRGIYLLCNVVADNMGVTPKGQPPQESAPSRMSLYEELMQYTRGAVSSLAGSNPFQSSSAAPNPMQTSYDGRRIQAVPDTSESVLEATPAPAPFASSTNNGLKMLVDSSRKGKSSRSLVEDVLDQNFVPSTRKNNHNHINP